MKLITLLICASGLLFLTGCYTTNIMPYAGKQQAWPTADGAFVDTKQSVPVYYGLPSRPYAYIAQVQIIARDAGVDVTRIAAYTAKTQGADALLILSSGERPVSSSGFGSGFASANNGVASGFGSSFFFRAIWRCHYRHRYPLDHQLNPTMKPLVYSNAPMTAKKCPPAPPATATVPLLPVHPT